MRTSKKSFYLEIIEELKKREYSSKQLAKLKRDLSLKYCLKKIPTNFEILLHASPADLDLLKRKLLTKPTRTISGVAPLALMSLPFPCPHVKRGIGPCLMCPGGPNSYFGEVPQSYTGKEPATLRGLRNQFDPYFQVFNRLEQFILLGHSIEKVELIIMGGTFPSLPWNYQRKFVWGAFKALNDFGSLFFKKRGFDLIKFKEFFELPLDNLGDEKRIKRIHQKLRKIKGSFREGDLLKEQKRNEKAKVRCVALCLETRPDCCQKKEIERMLELGCTRVELGLQHTDNQILKKIKRGHSVEESIQATKLLKNYFLKVGYHILLGLPGSSLKKDKEMMLKLFQEPSFRPDALKIYPCLVLPGTPLFRLYREGKYRPLSTEKAAKLIAWFKERVPPYCRLLRIQRDIPSSQIIAGVSLTNLRQYIHQKYQPFCQCIRCREPKNKKINFEKIKIKISSYFASQGEEFFISAEETKNNLLLGFCRLRIFDHQAGIRELHVYGPAAPLGKKGLIQHQGLGKRLLTLAEKIAKEKGIKELKVISGIGVREYYRRLKYRKKGAYLVKKL